MSRTPKIHPTARSGVALVGAPTPDFALKVARSVIGIYADGIIRYRKVRPLVGLLLPPNDDQTVAAIRAAQHTSPLPPPPAPARD